MQYSSKSRLWKGSDQDFSDLPGLIGDDGIAYPHWTKQEDDQGCNMKGKKINSQTNSVKASITKSHPKGKRKEAPPLHYTARGSKKSALDVAADDALMTAALGTYVDEWRSAGDTSDAYWSTWCQLHRAHWDGLRRPALPPVPLVPLFIHVVGALLKVGGLPFHEELHECSKGTAH